METKKILNCRFFNPDVKLGFDYSCENFCLLTEQGVTFYSDLDEFVNEFKDFIIRLRKSHSSNNEKK